MGLFFNRKPKALHAAPEWRELEDWMRKVDLTGLGFAGYHDLTDSRESFRWMYGVNAERRVELSLTIIPDARPRIVAMIFKGSDPRLFASGALTYDSHDADSPVPGGFSLRSPVENKQYEMIERTWGEFWACLNEAMRDAKRLVEDGRSWGWVDIYDHSKGVRGAQ